MILIQVDYRLVYRLLKTVLARDACTRRGMWSSVTDVRKKVARDEKVRPEVHHHRPNRIYIISTCIIDCSLDLLLDESSIVARALVITRLVTGRTPPSHGSFRRRHG